MSNISAVNSSNKVNSLDSRSVSKVIYLGCSNTGTSENVITDVHPALLGQKNQDGGIAEVKAIQLSTLGNEAIPKWTQEYDTDLAQSVKYVKLTGISTPDVPRVIQVTENQDPDNFNDGGVFIPGAPEQINDTGGSSKTVVTGLGNKESYIIASDLVHEGSPFDYAGYILFPQSGRHLYLAPDGNIHICFSARWGTEHAVALYAKSQNNGIDWSVSRIDASWSGYQMHPCMAADINGNIHFVWAECTLPGEDNSRRNIKYRKLSKSGTWGSIKNISNTTINYNYEPVIQMQRNGLTASIIWSGQGHGDHPSSDGYNILYKTVSSGGTVSSLTEITEDADDDLFYWNPSLDFDSNGYRHINFFSSTSLDLDNRNVYYIRETSGGLQAMIKINTEDNYNLHLQSNIVVDNYNNAWIAYGILNSGWTKLYIKKITNGTLSSRIEIEPGTNPDYGSLPQIQCNSNNEICVVYYNGLLSDVYHIQMKKVDQELNVGSRTTLYSTTSNYYTIYPHLAWSSVPTINSVIPNVPRKGIMCISIDESRTDSNLGNLVFTISENCIVGATELPEKMNVLTTNIRGTVNTTSFNSAFKPAIT